MDIVRRLLLVLTFVFAVAIAPAVAQIDTAHPNLTGVWILDLGKSQLPKQLKMPAETVVISCSGPNISMRTTVGGKEFDSTYIAEGRKHRLDRIPVLRVVTKTYWKKSVLVIEENPNLAMMVPAPGADPIAVIPPTSASPWTVDHWTLSVDGLTLKREAEASGLRLVFAYNKQP